MKLNSFLPIFYRHVGDLGNLWEDEYGEVQTMFRDDVISLNGKNSIIGRAAVVSTVLCLRCLDF